MLQINRIDIDIWWVLYPSTVIDSSDVEAHSYTLRVYNYSSLSIARGSFTSGQAREPGLLVKRIIRSIRYAELSTPISQSMMALTNHGINQFDQCSTVLNSQWWISQTELLTNKRLLKLRNIQGKACLLIQNEVCYFSTNFNMLLIKSYMVKSPPTSLSSITVISIPILSPFTVPSPTCVLQCWFHKQ